MCKSNLARCIMHTCKAALEVIYQNFDLDMNTIILLSWYSKRNIVFTIISPSIPSNFLISKFVLGLFNQALMAI